MDTPPPAPLKAPPLPPKSQPLPAGELVDPSVLAATERSAATPPAQPGEAGFDDEPDQHHAAGFFNQPWVQNVLPLATSLAFHVGIITIGIILFKTLPPLLGNPNKEQVIIPQSQSLAKSKSPGGVKNPGPPADPNRESLQNQTKETDNAGFAADVSTKLAAAGGAGDTSAGFLGAAAHSGSGHSFGSGAGGGGTAPWGVPGGGGGMLPRSEIMGTGGNANDVVFLCDASGSMVSVFGQLKQELKRSISTMSVDENGAMKFNVVFFHDDKVDMLFKDGMHIATPDAKREATEFIDNQVSVGGTQPIPAIRAALQQKPQLLFVLTDGFDQIADMSTVTNEFRKADANGDIHINCIFLQSDEDPKLVAALKEIAAIGHGEFKAILKKDM